VGDRSARRGAVRRLSTETKQAFKTGFWATVVVIVAVAYMISRGLAKSGSREPYDGDSDDRDPPRH
jgi:hypothetical protein